MERALLKLATALACSLAMTALADTPVAERKAVFGDTTIYYNAFASTVLAPRVAQAYQLERGKGISLLNITVLKGAHASAADVSGQMRNEAGHTTQLQFKPVAEADSVSYIAPFALTEAGTYRFDIQVTAAGARQDVTFNQELFPSE